MAFLCSGTTIAQDRQQVVLFDGESVASVVHDPARPLALAATMLAGDLQSVTNQAAGTFTSIEDCGMTCVVIAAKDSPLLAAVAQDTGLDAAQLGDQWEQYVRVALPSRTVAGRTYLVIAGSDTRGAIWGTVDLTREMGVSAWEWWADVAPTRVDRLVVDGGSRLSKAPSVQYRGIFLNDEDWGLQPWAARTFEAEVGDIGPKTYGRIFQLMWRLKANLIWPAMHDSTTPFYQIAGNADAARDHAIVVGTSHAEPMMRNNVREWDDARGEFNFFTNRAAMLDYWRDRAEEVRGFENIYSVGLRGKHDSAMEGAATPEIARDTMAEVIGLQRDLLAEAQGTPATQIPQALTLYKEVLDLYGMGLKVPEDVTLVWPENNYGYINQLPTPAEQARSGGSGVYYHISYWGRPHDYLWLATTHPALIREQLDRAWQMQARRIWVVNVGDIKPGEYLTQYFLDLAFDDDQLKLAPRAHLERWMGEQFGAELGPEAAAILTRYYDLAFERRPEFMGFNQVEPTRPVLIGDYIRSGGAEAQQRIDVYAGLRAQAEALAARVPAERQDAFFQLVLYPVRGAASINERNLKLDLAALYTRQGRPVANQLSVEAQAAHVRIVSDTAQYNALGDGKWAGMMDLAPRRLPVFAEPSYPQARFAERAGCAVDASELTFVQGRPAVHALTIYGWGEDAAWTLAGQTGIVPGLASGRLAAGNGYQQRVSVSYDGQAAAPVFGKVTCGGKDLAISGRIVTATGPDAPVEIERTITLVRPEGGEPSPDWEWIDGLGSSGRALRSRLALASREGPAGTAALGYRFETGAAGDAVLHVVGLPVHPLTSANGLRLAVQVDDQPLVVLDFETHGRSDEWKRNVLSNSARRTIALPHLAPGLHSIRVHALDPGFLLDRLEVRLDGAPDRYGAPPLR
ncbi:hypothetical protein PK98_10460 [Croceibacterium mercuriale]|uniref:Gylcosyl hydrolase 115 C-terminal domain-containing protein n=1 Tax=Croceibacterium mercuriale TaxID=1572751 RepID=A0A0B2BYX5_9SPHN|nr:hypothetical protein PK98_10460 [Croceibacterium mercuriale]